MRAVLVVLALSGLASPAVAACPGAADALPASFSYEVTDGRHVAKAAVVLPSPADSVKPVAAAVAKDPTWTNLEARGAVPKPVALKRMLEGGKLEEPALDVTAEPDAQCPGATRVTATFAWSFGAVARLLGGDAKDLPALFALAVRDEIAARVLTTPDDARLRAGLASGGGATLMRVAPDALDVPDADFKPLEARLQELGKSKKVSMGDALGVFLDLHRKATAIAGFGALTAMSGTPTTTRGACPACDVGYSINAEAAPDGKGVSLSFGMHGIEKR